VKREELEAEANSSPLTSADRVYEDNARCDAAAVSRPAINHNDGVAAAVPG
jgi:hypothetical protein